MCGLREGLSLVKRRQLMPVIVELDASVVVHLVTHGVPECHPSSVLVKDIITLIEEGWVREVRHIYIEGKRCADLLANLDQSMVLGTSVLEIPPLGLEDLMEQDRSGPPSLRQ